MRTSAAAFVALLLMAGDARGDESLHATVTAAGGMTDNVLSAPENDPMVPKEGDGFSVITPGLTFAQERRRLIHVASYQLSANFYARHDEANSYSNRLVYQAIYAMSPRSELTLGASGATGRINTFTLLEDPQNADLEPLPAGGTSYAAGAVEQGYRRELSRAWRFEQGSGFRLFKNLDDQANQGTNYFWSNVVGLERSWQYDSMALRMRSDYTVTGRGSAPDGTPFPSDAALMLGPEARWLHDFTLRISAEATGGLMAVFRADDFRRGLVQPTGGLAVRYVHDRGRAEVSYRHGVQANIFVAETAAIDQISARAGVPIPGLERASISAAVGYQRGRILNLEEQLLEGTTELFFIDGAASWRINRELALALRAQRYRQSRDEAMIGTLQGYERHQVLLSLTARWPGRQAATMPFRGGARVDQSDEDAFGQSDAHAPAGTDRR